MRIAFCSILLLMTGVQTAFAQATIDDAGEKLVKDFVTDVITLQGRFEQSLIDAEGAVIEVSSGTLEIERPTKFRWTYSDPYEQWLVADGLNIWSYDVDLAQVTVKPQAKALSNTPALLLGGGSEALEQFRFDGSMIGKRYDLGAHAAYRRFQRIQPPRTRFLRRPAQPHGVFRQPRTDNPRRAV